MDLVATLQKTARGAGGEFSRYFLVSLVALGLDFSTFLFLAKFIHYSLAAVVGFLLGAVVHYLLSIMVVFSRRKLSARRTTEFVLFVGTAVAGLLVNVATISACVEWFGASLFVAKTVAAGASFLFGYVVRKFLLF